MAKTYIDTVKYVVHATIEIDGIVEKPDVVGALFGQTEGLVGEELDFRELQKSGRIGRIEVNIEAKAGKSVGEILLPSSLDKVETSILAAALETVDRVGPCEAKIKVTRIEDTRTMKRGVVVDRAKDILKTMMGEMSPERKEISETVRSESRTAEVREWGPDKVAIGPEAEESMDIIVVEGRADVISLLRAGYNNVISLQGKIVPPSVPEFLRDKKEITMFADGDRGGDLIVKQLADVSRIDFVAKAPDGKEVEELTGKEIIKSLRNRMPFDEFISRTFGEEPRYDRREYAPRRTFNRAGPRGRTGVGRGTGFRTRAPRDFQRTEYAEEAPKVDIPFGDKLRELGGTLRGVLLSSDGSVINEVDVKDIPDEMEKRKDAETVVFDGIITQRLVDIADKNGVKNLIGVKKSKIDNYGGVKVYTP